MRAAAIFGPGCSNEDRRPFEADSEVTWLTELPRRSDEADVILIFGGDGTVHRYLPQLVELGIPVLVAPFGSGNDFARALGMGGIRDSLRAWRRFSSRGDNVRSIDLGVITPLVADRYGTGESPVPHYFCCVGGVGLDAEIARRANGLPRWLRARGGYVLSFLPALLSFAPIAMKISVLRPDDRDNVVPRMTKRIMVAAFANAPTYGGGMKIAPRAQLDDGALDVCVVHKMSKFKLCFLFPSVYFGRHLSIAGVEYFQAGRLRLETEETVEVYADGEYVCRTPIEVSVARAALRVIGEAW
jgi:diacylglycerol kinase (ATP)